MFFSSRLMLSLFNSIRRHFSFESGGISGNVSHFENVALMFVVFSFCCI